MRRRIASYFVLRPRFCTRVVPNLDSQQNPIPGKFHVIVPKKRERQSTDYLSRDFRACLYMGFALLDEDKLAIKLRNKGRKRLAQHVAKTIDKEVIKFVEDKLKPEWTYIFGEILITIRD